MTDYALRIGEGEIAVMFTPIFRAVGRRAA